MTLKLKIMIKILNLIFGGRERIPKRKNFFVKDCAPNWSEEVFVIKNIKNTVPWTYVIQDINSEEIIGMFYEKITKEKTNQRVYK